MTFSIRAVRVARALALLSSGASLSCGGGSHETATHEAGLTEAGPSDAAPSPTAMSCVEAEEQVSCKPGGVCHVDTTVGFLHCDEVEAGVNKPCGAIQCGYLCGCIDPAQSTCECYGGAGPLPPPDLPNA